MKKKFIGLFSILIYLSVLEAMEVRQEKTFGYDRFSDEYRSNDCDVGFSSQYHSYLCSTVNVQSYSFCDFYDLIGQTDRSSNDSWKGEDCSRQDVPYNFYHEDRHCYTYFEDGTLFYRCD